MSAKQSIIFLSGTYILVSIILYFYASPELISIFFRLLNFALVIGIVIILYQRKLGSYVHELMNKGVQKQEALAIRHDELIQEQRLLTKRLEDQDQLCRYLLGKINIWRDVFEKMEIMLFVICCSLMPIALAAFLRENPLAK